MPQIEIVAQKIKNQLYAAVLDKGKVIDLYADSKAIHAKWSSIYLGKVEKIDTALDGAFVNIGGNQTGFLSAKHVHKKDIDTKSEPISSLLEPGQMIMVQVKSEGHQKTEHEHQKQPRLTMKLYIPGRTLIYSPTAHKVTVSRHINNKDIFSIANDLKSKGGWIIRDAAEKAGSEQLMKEAEHLKKMWKNIHDLKKNKSTSPRLLMEGPNAICRAIMDYSGYDVKHIDIAEDCKPDQIKMWCEHHLPGVCEKINVEPVHKVDLFEQRDIHGTIESAIHERVDLKDGGSLIIEDTHALTVVDVNRGSASDIKTLNKQAALEVARQLKLRNISGAILVDFLNLRLRSDRYNLIETLENAVKMDPGKTQIHGFTRLGIMEITRTRRTATLSEKYMD